MKYAMLVLCLLLVGCAREFTLPFDGLYIDRQECADNNACTMDIYFWKLQQNHDTTYYCNHSMIADCDTTNYCDTVDCDDRTYCTADWCDTTRELCQHQYACEDNDACTADDCEGIYCIYDLINCDDTDNCTNDYCIGGVCINITVNCDDGVFCTIDACVPQDGLCENMDTCTINPPCDTIADPLYTDPFTGLESFCKLIVCGQNTTRSCDDGDACTNDYCLEGARECVNSDVNCDDGSDCVTTGWCWCEAGYCVYGSSKRVPVSEVKQIQASEWSRTTVHDVNGKLLMEILPDRVREAAMIITHYPKGIYFIRTVTESGEIRTRKLFNK